MKITHRKQKGERYALVFETNKEAKAFRHYVECRDNLENCTVDTVKNDKFHKILELCVLDTLPV